MRLLLAQGEGAGALALTERWHAPAVAEGRVGSAVVLRILAALAHQVNDDDAAASSALADALATAAPEGHVRVFVDDGAPLAGLLRDLMVGRRLDQLARGVPHAFVTRLVAAFERAGRPIVAPARAGAVAVPGLVEPLSARELQVLELIAAGHPNRIIAERLVITVDTVKRHVSHVFNKLSVANRTEAVARARQLELLP